MPYAAARAGPRPSTSCWHEIRQRRPDRNATDATRQLNSIREALAVARATPADGTDAPFPEEAALIADAGARARTSFSAPSLRHRLQPHRHRAAYEPRPCPPAAGGRRCRGAGADAGASNLEFDIAGRQARRARRPCRASHLPYHRSRGRHHRQQQRRRRAARALGARRRRRRCWSRAASSSRSAVPSVCRT